MSAPPARPFFAPMFGLVALFAALGPAIGGAAFVLLAMFAEAGPLAAAHFGWVAWLIGHAFVLIPAYVLGLLPAAFAGLAYALYDAWAPPALPRALGAALIGALFAHGLYLWLRAAGAAIEAWVEIDGFVADWTAGEFDAGLYHALIAAGAAAGFACAAVAGLFGLSMDVRRT
jgi:hypothetical protein